MKLESLINDFALGVANRGGEIKGLVLDSNTFDLLISEIEPMVMVGSIDPNCNSLVKHTIAGRMVIYKERRIKERRRG